MKDLSITKSIVPLEEINLALPVRTLTKKKKKQNLQATVNLVQEKLQLYFKKEYLAGFENLTT